MTKITYLLMIILKNLKIKFDTFTISLKEIGLH